MKFVIELIGIFATLIILASMLFKTTTIKGSIIMRVLNLIGAAILMIYGILLPALSTAILNGALIFVNFYHIVLLYKEGKDTKKHTKKSNKTNLDK